MRSEFRQALLKRDITGREDARSFVDQVRLGMGGLTRETRELLARTAPEALYANDNLRHMISAATKTLATNLYTKDTRFAYELIQNAEDNRYSIANGKQEIPWLEFRLFYDRIEIDSNEDGFSKEDILSICSTGESTKGGTQAFIGEKGIGFKSVFKIAHKVHIQSGLFSFAFEYNPEEDDSGLGMVTPLNEAYLDIPAKVRTRITLHLVENQHIAMKKEFLDLPHNLLLFLKKLKNLSIKIFHPEEQDTEITHLVTTSGKISKIDNTVDNTRSTQRFWITQGQAKNMPKDPARPRINEAEVVLAFPLDASDCPIIANQYVSAFLPLRRVGYKFLIQSDFITQASLVVAFCNSVNEFLAHESLKYSWVRYLPDGSIADDFWRKLQETLLPKIRSLYCILDHAGRWRVQPCDARVMADVYRGDDQAPLVPDLNKNPGITTRYVSDSYDAVLDIPIIKFLGGVMLSLDDFLTRLEIDLCGPSALMKSDSTDETWHSKVADILIFCLSSKNTRRRVMVLEIIPLQSSQWARSLNASIFFPTSGGVEIPPNLPLSLVRSDALRNLDRKRLFQELGVQECAPHRIFPLIEQQARSGISFVQSLSHLKFIFWHHKEISFLGITFYLAPQPSDGKGWYNPRDQSRGWIYSPISWNHESHSMSKILDMHPGELKGKLNILQLRYYDAVTTCEKRNHTTGREWLEQYFQLKDVPQLMSRNDKALLSSEMVYIMEQKPQFLLRVLESNWDCVVSSPRKLRWISKFKKVLVPAGMSDRLRLDTTYVPVPKLKNIATQYGLDKNFPFLEELEDITDATAPKWHFTKALGVGIEDDLRFWTTLLQLAKEESMINDDAVFEIYGHLHRFSFTGLPSQEYEEAIENAFSDMSIYIPSRHSNSEETSNWCTAEECVWKGPEWFDFKVRLGDMEEYQRLSPIFQDILQIQDADLDDFLDYLDCIQNPDQYDKSDIIGSVDDLVSNIYKEIYSKSEGKRAEIRTAFNDSELIYHPQTQSWHSPESCIWAEDNIQLPGKISLASIYQNHKTFFVSVLQVEEPNLEMHITALKERVASQESKENIIMEMMNIAALSPESQALKPLLSCRCLPVRLPSGQIEWQNAQRGEFAIVDRQEYGAAFEGKIKMLDLTLEQVHPLSVLLSGLGLNSRYMSHSVSEKTEAKSGDVSETLSRQLNKKAYAICRYAAHHGSASISADPQAFLRLLEHAKVFTSDDINKHISIHQGNQTITVEGDQAYVHLTQEKEGQEGQLKIYVPKGKRWRRVCFMSHLPTALLHHFGARISSSGGLGSILSASENLEIIEFLRNAGIITLIGIETPTSEEDTPSENENVSDSEDGNETAIPGYAEISLISRSTPSDLRARSSAGLFTPASITNVPLRSSSFSPPEPVEQDHYRRLLDAVIQQGQETSALPRRGRDILASRGWDQTVDTSSAMHSPIPGEMEFLIGAAGELFVFERLSKLRLPGFSRRNWQSTIRHRVSVHQDYRDLDAWSGSETADIVYHDQQGTLTNHLILSGYLDVLVWGGQTPTYYIEVKATVSSCDTRFFCSQLQYDRMEEMKLPRTAPAPRVYLVARVFNLRGPGIGLKLYVDPATLRDKGELRFKTDSTYHITPIG